MLQSLLLLLQLLLLMGVAVFVFLVCSHIAYMPCVVKSLGVLGPRGRSGGREGVSFPYRRKYGGAATQGVLQGASRAACAVQVGRTVTVLYLGIPTGVRFRIDVSITS